MKRINDSTDFVYYVYRGNSLMGDSFYSKTRAINYACDIVRSKGLEKNVVVEEIEFAKNEDGSNGEEMYSDIIWDAQEDYHDSYADMNRRSDSKQLKQNNMKRVKDSGDRAKDNYNDLLAFKTFDERYAEIRHCWVSETGDSYYDYEVVIYDGDSEYSIRGSYVTGDELTLDEVVEYNSQRRITNGDEEFFHDIIEPIIINSVENAIDNNDFVSDSKQLKQNNMKRIKDNQYSYYIQQNAKVLDKYAAIDRPFYEDMEDNLRSKGFILNDELHLYENDSDWKEYWTLANDDETEGLIVWGGSDSNHNSIVYSVSYANKSDFTAWKNRELEAEKHYRQVKGVSDSRCVRSLTRRIKDSVKAKNIRRKITDAKAKYFTNDLKRMQAYRRVTDSKGKIKENVVFLIEDSDVLAVFPNTYGTANRDRDTMVCYSHNGQHGVCTYDYANTLKTADSKNYNDLKDELTNYVGYNLTIVDSLPSETELKQNAKEIRDAYINHKRHAITDERLLARGEEIEYKGKRGTVQYALFHAKEPVIVRWQNDEGSEEFEIPYNEVSTLKIHDSEDDDVNVEPVDNDSDIDDEVTDNCGGKKKTKKKTADNAKRVKITKRQTKKSE